MAEIYLEILKLPENEATSTAITEVARRWGKTDLKSAVESAKGLPTEGEFRRAFYRGFGEQLAQEDPEELLNTIAGEKDCGGRASGRRRLQRFESLRNMSWSRRLRFLPRPSPESHLQRQRINFPFESPTSSRSKALGNLSRSWKIRPLGDDPSWRYPEFGWNRKRKVPRPVSTDSKILR